MFNKTFLSALLSFQMSLAESIVLVYDPLKTAQGMLSFRAFRITQRYLDLIKYEPDSCEYPDPTLEEIRRSKILSKVTLELMLKLTKFEGYL